MSIKLAYILNSIEVMQVQGDTGQYLAGLTFDSRMVLPDFLFVAVKGTQSDGHDFIEQAVAAGASAVICEHRTAPVPGKVTFIKVRNTAHALANLASAFYDHPSRKFKLVGITGTNGKTTTVTLLHRLFTSLGYKSGCFTTIRNYIGNETIESTHTTPDPVQLNRIMKDMADSGCEYVFMEVSSHALIQERIAGLHFTGGIFSNITHDHLDYHRTFDEYIRAKKLFFDNLPAESFSLINADDRNGRVMIQNTKSTVSYFGIRSMADFKGRIIESHVSGMLLNFDHTELWTSFIGEFNASNLLAVYACARLLGQDKEEILRVISTLETVEGRFQSMRSQKGVTAIIDYAHTPDALQNVLKTISQIRKGTEQVITVIGAGGNRDRSKRPVMAKVAAGMSEKLILTADNPRNEDPLDIINDMKAGLDTSLLGKTIIQPDRREAIKTACLLARTGDIILIAGKGHETYQEIQGIKHHFSDREVVASLFEMNAHQP
jgi:UDP-N-acetylmuramoyl-L-alanyl-D-glutamate--2,6-diaminopimelate ligase